jgi:hypothetical protein
MFSTLILARRLPMVPVLSSAAKMPFPGVAMYLAFFTSSSAETKKLNPYIYAGFHQQINITRKRERERVPAYFPSKADMFEGMNEMVLKVQKLVYTSTNLYR